MRTEIQQLCEAQGLDPGRIPDHVAIIMDGNGRWARERGESRVFGHMHGVDAVRFSVEAAMELGVRYLTLYAFSTENWSRPKEEVEALMNLLVDTLVQEIKELGAKGVRLRTIGDVAALPKNCQDQLQEAEKTTENNETIDLILALSYSSKWEMVQAIKMLIESGYKGDEVTEEVVTKHLSTEGIPDPELMIRTSGEHRISNFLLWQLAYAEFHFTSTLWPDFGKESFFTAIRDFQNRERRFGGLLDTNHNVAAQ
ncbi:MAG: isoprenyl transferase [Crocinitomicaceae bacterium]|jgi:undecaprenyl diphosphate synthase|nr:isoprenyl transferase [Crocinitomicaceae bacterium]|tara:strand:+ start:1093 stop:1857 length:765 start_codon:yes stop_codon:yes gene_type:complete